MTPPSGRRGAPRGGGSRGTGGSAAGKGRGGPRGGGPGSDGARRGRPHRPDQREPSELGGDQVEGRRAVLELLTVGRRTVRQILLAEDQDPSAQLDRIEELAARLRVPVETVPRHRLDAQARTEAPQGVLALARPVEPVSLEDLCAPGRQGVQPFLLVAAGITDPRNLGALLRSAECAGVNGVVLPRHRSARLSPTVAKTAAGAIEHLRFAVVGGIPAALVADDRPRGVVGRSGRGVVAVALRPPARRGPDRLGGGERGEGIGPTRAPPLRRRRLHSPTRLAPVPQRGRGRSRGRLRSGAATERRAGLTAAGLRVGATSRLRTSTSTGSGDISRLENGPMGSIWVFPMTRPGARYPAILKADEMEEVRGWHPDPFGVHEQRYFSLDGKPTRLVSDGGRTSHDPPPQSVIPDAPIGPALTGGPSQGVPVPSVQRIRSADVTEHVSVRTARPVSASSSSTLHGWQPDPYAVHEQRYFTRGEPTRLVKDDGRESYDDVPSPHYGGSRSDGAFLGSPIAGAHLAAPTALRTAVPSMYPPPWSAAAPDSADGHRANQVENENRESRRQSQNGNGYPPQKQPPGALSKHKRPIIASIGALALALAVGVGVLVSTQGSGSTADAAVVRAVTSAINGKTAHVAMKAEIRAAGETIEENGSGAVDFTNNTLDENMTETFVGQQITAQVLYFGGSIYLSTPKISQLAPGKDWASLNASSFDKGEAQEGLGGDPLATLHELALEGNTVSNLGASIVDGKQVQGYDVTFDKAVLQSEIDKADVPSWMKQALAQITVSGASAKVYVDGTGNLVRETEVVSESANEAGTISVSESVDFSDYGTPVSIPPAPAASQVLPYSQLLNLARNASTN